MTNTETLTPEQLKEKEYLLACIKDAESVLDTLTDDDSEETVKDSRFAILDAIDDLNSFYMNI